LDNKFEIVEEFSSTIQHRPGAGHANADTLSRRPCSVRVCLCGKSTKSVAKLGSLKKCEKKGLTIQEVRVTRQRGK